MKHLEHRRKNSDSSIDIPIITPGSDFTRNYVRSPPSETKRDRDSEDEMDQTTRPQIKDRKSNSVSHHSRGTSAGGSAAGGSVSTTESNPSNPSRRKTKGTRKHDKAEPSKKVKVSKTKDRRTSGSNKGDKRTRGSTRGSTRDSTRGSTKGSTRGSIISSQSTPGRMSGSHQRITKSSRKRKVSSNDIHKICTHYM